jgi:hypothetical protein
MVSGTSFISKKIKRTRILKKISPKSTPSGSGIQDPGTGKNHPDPDSGGKKAPDPGSGSATLLWRTFIIRPIVS